MKQYKVDVDDMKKKYGEVKQRVSELGASFWTPKEGNNEIRILPPFSDEGNFYKEVQMHFSVGPNNSAFPCPRQIRKECYLCDLADKFRASKDTEERSRASTLRPRLRVFYNIIDCNDLERGVQVYSSGITIFKEVLSYFADPEWGDITDPRVGYNLVIERTGTGIDTDYVVRCKKNPSKVPVANWQAGMKNLDDMVRFESAERMQEAFTGEPAPVSERKALGRKAITKTGAGPGEEIKEKEEEEKKVEETKGEKPKCFGKVFDAADSECRECLEFNDCAVEFFSKGQGKKPEREAVKE